MKIIFDGNEFEVKDSASNIVEVAQQNGVYIPAPCFRNNKSKGCCNGCLIEVNGKEGFACNTKPKDGMEIVYDREDLATRRTENLKKYSEAIKNGDLSKNTCSTGGCGCSCNSSSSCC